MFSVLHSAFQLSPHPGIKKQMMAEQAAADQLSLDWRCQLFTSESYDESVSVAHGKVFRNRFSARIAYYRWLYNQTRDHDILLLRHSLSDPLQVLFMWLVRKPVILVHHTLEIPQIEMYKGRFTRSKVLIERVCGRCSLARASALVCVTSEIEQYEQSRLGKKKALSYIYPNGLLEQKATSPRSDSLETSASGDSPVQMVFAASSFIDWHGLDKVIDAVEASSEDFTLHLAGLIEDESLRIRAMSDARIKVHGVIESDELQGLISACDIGLGSFALERKGMQEACPLKVRDYLNAGLPVYAGHPDIFPSDFAYYRQGPCDFDKIAQYARQTRDVQKQVIATAAQPFIDKRSLVQGLHDFLARHFLNDVDSTCHIVAR